ncbi:MAG: hypothetical protein GF331_21665 [Chitinivibrionales bacterium]|nr:hypothetical protein [Chitinivibrionales bacterium]
MTHSRERPRGGGSTRRAVSLCVCLLAALYARGVADTTETTDSLLSEIDLGSYGAEAAKRRGPLTVDTLHFELQLPFDKFTLKYAVVEWPQLREALLIEHARYHDRRVFEVVSPTAVHLAILHRMGLPVVAAGRAWELRGNIQPVYMDRLVSAERVQQSRLDSDKTRVAICFALLGPLTLRTHEPVAARALAQRRDLSVPCTPPAHPDRGLVLHDRDTYNRMYVLIDKSTQLSELHRRVEATMDRLGLPLTVPTPTFELVTLPAVGEIHER